MNLKLNKNEILCLECNGTGKEILIKDDRKSRVMLICRLCGGEGKIDWIQNVQRIPKQFNTYLSIDNKTGKEVYIKEANLTLNPGLNYGESINRIQYIMSEYPEIHDKLFKENELDIVELSGKLGRLDLVINDLIIV